MGMQSPSHAAQHMVSEQNVSSYFPIAPFPARPTHQPARRFMLRKQTTLGRTSTLLPALAPLPGAPPLPLQEATRMRPPPSTDLPHPTPHAVAVSLHLNAHSAGAMHLLSSHGELLEFSYNCFFSLGGNINIRLTTQSVQCSVIKYSSPFLPPLSLVGTDLAAGTDLPGLDRSCEWDHSVRRWLWCPASFTRCSWRPISVVTCGRTSLLFIPEQPALLIQSAVDRHLGCFQISAIININNAASNTQVLDSVCTPVFSSLGYTLRSGIASPYAHSVFNF